ncbi:DegT/DnrJ/EryC1/StrS family aminotransferase [Ochrobactrum sp. SFR4]|uniref:DegT/DnrJ/EryC1/StrS family aminotransferase n=1 Tax=Ochrobactrum sp. SFR4 TaxID=2717368 RepID=UPI001C8BAC31|nr:DegT/DnrJ/EryC1/StrS family aminotransferase [Ochrobactrum sp. SFR4]MBX8827220.1 DegT/DnrJ/EryC1/StrS family aminotransferase [Ochrobactrum sp. SFR4]
MDRAPLYVAKPLLPNVVDMHAMVSQIWQSGVVTNHGPLHEQLERRLVTELGAPTVKLFNNGTIALLAALKMFDLPRGSEVITTPLTFAATAHSIAWNGLKPVFVDVDARSWTLDPHSVQAAINQNTSAILGVHVYGNVCDLQSLENLANKNSLKLIYDAAHAFGVEVNGKGIGNFGDATMFSFHATKLFNTIEGGALTTPNATDSQKIYMLRNFGIKNEDEVIDIGLNGKMNELQAAVGLANLEIYRHEMLKRSSLRKSYNELLSDLPGIHIQLNQDGVSRSEQYYPIRIIAEEFGRSRDQIYDELKKVNIFSRKYFHPICTDFEPYKNEKIISILDVPNASILKNQVLCLPFHSGVSEEHIEMIAKIMKQNS